MRTPSRRTFTHAAVLLGVGLFALGGVSRIPPLRLLERQLVKGLAVAVDPVATILDGSGSQDQPWTRRKGVPPVIPPPPRVLNIDDDPEGYFSTSPLAPIDHALIFARLHEAGHKVLGVGHLMAWDEPEPLATEALRKQLDRFDAAVLALPLARGAVPEPVAAPFLRWSVRENEVRGKIPALPQVNRIAIPNAEQGGAKSLAGFSLLENESDPGEGTQPLLARWGDRIIFAFPLAVEIAAEGLTPSDVQIHLGKEIRIGSSGPVIGIDEFGRGAIARGVEAIETPAKRLISEGPEAPKSKPLLTRDTRTGLATADQAWSDQLPARVQALRAAPRYEPAMILRRPDALVELLLVLLLAFAGTLAATLKSFPWRIVASFLTVGLACEFLYLFASRQNAWLPPLAMLSPGLLALGCCFRKKEPAEERPVDTAMAELAGAEPKASARPLAQPNPAVTAAPPGSRPVEASAPPEEVLPPQAPPTGDPIPKTITRVRIRDLLLPEKPAGEEVPSRRPVPEDPPPPNETSDNTAPKGAAKKAPRQTARKSKRKSGRGRAAEDSAGAE